MRTAVLSSSWTQQRRRLLLQLPVQSQSFSSEVLSELPDVCVLLRVLVFRREERMMRRRDGKGDGRIRWVNEASTVEGEEVGGEFVLVGRKEYKKGRRSKQKN